MSKPNGANGDVAAQQPTIDQVRELLFGNEQRTLEAQLITVREELKATRAEFDRQLSELRQELSGKIEKSDQSSRDRIRRTGEAIAEIGRNISALSEK